MSDQRGSIWRKWDLHLHSPLTHSTSNRYNQTTIEQFCEVLKNKKIDVIGLTNYFCFAYKEIETVKNELGDSCLVIPNIEFRAAEKNKKGQYINFHILF